MRAGTMRKYVLGSIKSLVELFKWRLLHTSVLHNNDTHIEFNYTENYVVSLQNKNKK